LVEQYITLDDIMDLMGSAAVQSEDAMRRMWGDSIKAVKCQHARITYDDFLLLMKGQSQELPGAPCLLPSPADIDLGASASSPLSMDDDEDIQTAIYTADERHHLRHPKK
jgi:hypothetical protein